MNVILNGESFELSEPYTVRQLIAQLEIAGHACAVEVNQTVVPKRLHERHTLAEGDRVELVTLVGGG